jgi:hypothetical protein
LIHGANQQGPGAPVSCQQSACHRQDNLIKKDETDYKDIADFYHYDCSALIFPFACVH